MMAGMQTEHACELEERIFAHMGADGARTGCRAIFILGAPRTGSTLLYQLLIRTFELPYVSNLTNEHFATTPIVGLLVQSPLIRYEEIGFDSTFGKVAGLLQPSEGSAVLHHWFGGGHPSQLTSADFMSDRESHFVRTVTCARAALGKPLLIKNAWNCFRIASLARALPDAWFIWTRRDLADAAKSDLHARYATKGSAVQWNSATPANWRELCLRPYVEQVVENQFEFNRAIERDLRREAPERWAQTWYENVCADSETAVDDLRSAVMPLLECGAGRARRGWAHRRRVDWDIPLEDAAGIDAYIRHHAERFGPERGPETRRPRSTSRAQMRQPAPTDSAAPRLVDVHMLRRFMRRDVVAERLATATCAGDAVLASHRWLAESAPKRLIYHELYGDLLDGGGLRIVDVGGGLTALTRELARRHRYTLVDLMAHDDPSVVEAFRTTTTPFELVMADWYEFEAADTYDVVIANDLFPNVDQRLELFLERFIPRARAIRLSLTYHPEPRFYRTRRVDGQEIMTLLAWDGRQTQAALERYAARINAADLGAVFGGAGASVFPNGRQVCLLSVRGDARGGDRP
jgi:hypothetical protein